MAKLDVISEMVGRVWTHCPVFSCTPTAGAAIAFCWLAMVTLGCRSGEMPVAPVSGHVTLEGEPVRIGLIIFEPQAGPAATATLDSEGNYELGTRTIDDGAVIGTHHIYFRPPDLASPGESAPAIPLPRPPQPEFVPVKYRNPATSGLIRVVEHGSNRFNFELSSE